MTDFYSTMAPFECITCSENDFNNFKCVLMTEKKRLEKDELWFCLDAEYHAGELFIFNEYYFDDECLTDKVCSAIGELLRISGQEYLEFGYSYTASRVVTGSQGGGYFRIYKNGSLVRPNISW
jgi:hypothetical protein